MNLPEGWPTDEMVDKALIVLRDRAYISLEDGRRLVNLMIRAALAAAPTPPTQEDEPVAEIRLDQGEAIIDLTKILEQSVGTKFYTRPADDKLRKAAEEVVHLIGLWISANEIILTIPEAAKVRNLRTALEGNNLL